MPDYTIRLPDGREVTVRNAPDEASARRRVQEEFNLPPSQNMQTPEQQRGANLGTTYSRLVNDVVSRVPSLSGAADALPRSMNLSDELTGLAARGAVGIRNAVRGESNDLSAAGRAASEDERRQVAQYREDNPLRSMGEEVVAQAGAAMLSGGTSLGSGLARFAASRPVMAGALFGGAEGAISGAGAGEGLRDRATRGAQGAAIGAAAGGALAGGGRLVSDALGGRRAAIPEIEQLQAAKTAAYEQVDNLGARFSRDSVDDLFSAMRRQAEFLNINPSRHGPAAEALNRLESIVGDGDVSLTRLDQLRQVIRRDVMNVDDANDLFGGEMIRAIDEYIANASPRDMVAGSAEDAARAILAARSANSQFRKSEMVADAIERARLRAASTGSGGNEENAIRQNLRRLIEPNSRTRNFFSEQERAAIQQAVEGDSIQNVLRLVSKFAPSSGGLSAWLGVGASAAAPPLGLPLVAAGETARAVGSARQQAALDGVERLLRTGSKDVPPPLIARPLATVGGAVGGATSARALEEDEEQRRRRMYGPR